MIDKADLRIVGGTHFTREFSELTHAVGEEVWRKSKAYDRSGDFRRYGLPVIVHLDCKLTKKPVHKLEIIEAGEKTFSQIVELGSRIFEGDPQTWEIARADLTADVPGVKVQWFRDHTYFAYKRQVREFGYIPPEVPIQSIRSSRAQTLYGGKKPNQTRIYDKIGEQMVRYQKYCRGLERRNLDYEVEMIPPTFEQWTGHKPGDILTRVERACLGRDLDKLGITNLESLRKAHLIRPYEQIRFFADNVEDLSRERWRSRDYYIGHGIRQDIIAYGIDQTREILRSEQRSNFTRWWNKYQPFIRAAVSDYREVGITSAQLQATYEDSTRWQMAA